MRRIPGLFIIRVSLIAGIPTDFVAEAVATPLLTPQPGPGLAAPAGGTHTFITAFTTGIDFTPDARVFWFYTQQLRFPGMQRFLDMALQYFPASSNGLRFAHH